VATRKGPPCPECGKLGCKSQSTFACWVRCHKLALAEHGYARCGSNTVMLRKAGVHLLLAPQPAGNEVWYGPDWAVRKLADLRKQASSAERRLYGLRVEQALRSDPRFGPLPAAMTDRLEVLRAFAVLRGWRLHRGSWHK